MSALVPVDDRLWSAVGDPTRRQVLDLLLVDGPCSASGLGRQLPVSRQAVAKHLTVLEAAGLVSAQNVGREVRYGVDEEQLAKAIAQLTAVGRAWDQRLDKIRAIAERIERARRS